MTKFEIMALMMRKEYQFEGDAFTLAAKLASCLEPISDRLRDDELAELVQVGAAIYRRGVDEYGRSVPPEDLFPACENWPVPNPNRDGFRHHR
ncbi:MAG TPA: hypothetical protein VEC35_24820 [Noviherbaspirillum sp.]|nr:hypothetical protein [Noviherbaspirillum sp.]